MPSPLQLPPVKLPPTVWNKIEVEAVKRAARGQDIIALHIGDTHLPFPNLMLVEAEDEKQIFSSLNRYNDTYGDPHLRERILQKVIQRNRLPADGIDAVQITAGATGGLYAVFSHLCEPGSEILTPAPYWSILRQVADAAQVRLVEVPFFDVLHEDPASDAAALLESLCSANTAGIYLNTPSNPTGMLLLEDNLRRILDFAKRKDLWIFSDEAYEDYIWNNDKHISVGALPGGFARTISIYTVSKCFGSSGIRIGYCVAPPHIISQINRGVVGTCYHPDRLGQLHTWRGMAGFDDIVDIFRRDYAPTYRWVCDNLKCEALPCVGGFYFFVKLGADWRAMTPEAKVERMLDAGIALAPGEYFGDKYAGWARLCFTVVPPDKLKVGIERLNRLLER
ncbi:MAG: pyridoxal phosphate-dependent aminotransferase [Calditrichaeota bacterium]|nr:pyridoxal phosphate-dependent aminotransferase [Calditrichota bacterium]